MTSPEGYVQFPVYLTKKKHRQLFRKAERECKTASPAHDVLDLLVAYYINNKFVIHQKMRKADPNRPKLEKKKDRRIWITITREENNILTKKTTKDKMPKTAIVNLLIDHYLRHDFVVETRIIRVNNPAKSGT